jgi:hypothetical protein
MDAGGEIGSLPEAGRYLLWLADGGLALQTEAEVPPPEQFIGARELWFNETSLIPGFDGLAPSYIVFYSGSYEMMPEEAERAQVQARFKSHVVLFDDGGLVPVQEQVGNQTRNFNPSGLYLVEDGTIRYRYLYPEQWQYLHPDEGASHEAIGLIIQGTRDFLTGEEPEVFPAPLLSPGAALPDDLPVQDAPVMVLWVSSLAAEAPQNGWAVREDRSDIEWLHPGAQAKFLIETLTPLLERYGVRGVGLLYEDSERTPELETFFPGWRFTVVDSSEARLRWSEMRSALVADQQGRVYLAFAMIGAASEQPLGLDLLERALREVGQ